MTSFTRHELLAVAVHDVIEGRALRALGVSKGERETLLRREWLFPAFKDIFFITDRPGDEARWYAAVLHCGEGAVASFFCAAVLWRLMDAWTGVPHVTVPARRVTKPPDGIRVHRTRRPYTREMREGIPVTDLVRTLDDVSRHLTDSALRAAVGRAERLHALDLADLYDRATSKRLKRVLATYVAGRGLTDSELEARAFDVIATTSLPKPRMQRAKPGGRVDFFFPTLNYVVEVDGWGSHHGRVAFQNDRARDRANKRAGLETDRFTWADVVLSPKEFAAHLEWFVSRNA